MKNKSQIMRTIERIILIILILGIAKFSFKLGFVKDLWLHNQHGMLILIFGLLIMAFLVIAVHELGHILAGLIQGFKFELFVVGPLGIKKENDKIITYFNKNLSYYGGVSATHPIDDNPINSKKFGLILIAGPVASLLFALMCLLTSFLIGKPFGIVFFIGFPLSIAIFLATTIPSKSGFFFTDRKRYQRLNSQGKDRRVELALLNIYGIFMKENSYKNIKMDDVEELISDENSFIKLTGLFTLICYQLEQNGFIDENLKKQYETTSLSSSKSFVKTLNNELIKYKEKYNTELNQS
jgi:hypothetical protein